MFVVAFSFELDLADACTWPMNQMMPAECWVWSPEVGGRGFAGWWGGDAYGRWLDLEELGACVCSG